MLIGQDTTAGPAVRTSPSESGIANIMATLTRVNFEHKFQLQNELEKLPSHFNRKIEQDPHRLSYVYNEIVFKMDTMPDFFKPVLVNLIGFIECARGNGRRGARCFLNVKKMDDGNIICLANNAYMALKANDYAKVESIIRDVSRLKNSATKDGHIAAEIGHFYQWFGLNCAAMKEYEKALAEDPDNIIAMYGMAVVLYELSKHEGRVSGFRYLTRALDLFKKLMKICPYFTLARIYDGKARNQLISISLPDSTGDDEADRIFTQVMGTDCAPEILCMIGEEYLKLGVLRGEPCATSIFQRALEKRKNSKVYHLLALSLRATYFKENPDMHDVFKQGLFMKAQAKQEATVEKVEVKPRRSKAKQKEVPPEEQDLLAEGVVEEPVIETVPVTLDEVIETLSTAVKLSRGANREAVFDLAESLWLAGERLKAVTNFELASQSENVTIQLKAHLRLSQAFIDNGDQASLIQGEYHLNHIMKLDTLQEEGTIRSNFLKLLSDLAIAFIRNNMPAKAAEWVQLSVKLASKDHAQSLKQHMVYTRWRDTANGVKAKTNDVVKGK